MHKEFSIKRHDACGSVLFSGSIQAWLLTETYLIYSAMLIGANSHLVSVTFHHIESFELKLGLIDSCFALFFARNSNEWKNWRSCLRERKVFKSWLSSIRSRSHWFFILQSACTLHFIFKFPPSLQKIYSSLQIKIMRQMRSNKFYCALLNFWMLRVDNF